MPSLVIGKRGKDTLRRLLRSVGLLVLVLVLSLVLVYTAFRRWTLIGAPDDNGPPLPSTVTVEATESGRPRLAVGKSKLERSGGVWRFHLQGGPRKMGHSHGLLASRVTAAMDRRVASELESRIPGRFRRWYLSNVSRWRHRGLMDGIPPVRLVELAAFSRTMVDSAEFPEPPFHRLLYYHAMHELTREAVESPLPGSHMFAVWGKQTVESHMLVGRTFELAAGKMFDSDKALLLFQAEEGFPFISVAWPGMMGVVTGVNSRRLFVSVNSACSDGDPEDGIPLTLLAREILERAGTIKEAIKLIKQQPAMVPGIFMLADGKAQDAVVLEFTPSRTAIRRGKAGMVWAANHLVDPKFKGDAANDWRRRYSTSEARAKRLEQLLGRFGGRIDVETAAMILRNRTGVDDAPLGLGNRAALDALTATHGVVLDLSTFVLWISRGPHLLGAFEPVDLKILFGEAMSSAKAPKPIEADPLGVSPRLEKYRLALAQLAHARWLQGVKNLHGALDFATRAASMDPELEPAHKLRGDLLWQLERQDEARKAYRRYMELYPPSLMEREQVKSRLEE